MTAGMRLSAPALLPLLLALACGGSAPPGGAAVAGSGAASELDGGTPDGPADDGGTGDRDAERTEVAADAAAESASEVDPYDALFAPDRVLDVAIDIAADEWDALRGEGRSLIDIFGGDDCQSAPYPKPFRYYRASVTVDGERADDVGVRKKGFFGSLSHDKPSLKLDFGEFVAGQTLSGVERLTLNNAKQDPSYLNQCLGYALFRDAGVPAPRCGFATVRVNGEDLGLYVNVEPIKKPFLRGHFEDDEGNLYEGTLSDLRAGWMGTFERKTNQTSDPSRADLQAVVDALALPGDPQLALEPVIDLERFYAFWAVESLTAHIDGYSSNANNYYLYNDPVSGRFVFIPWGADQLFGNGEQPTAGGSPVVFTQGAIAAALYGDSGGRARYAERIRRLLADTFRADERLAEIERMRSLIAPHVRPEERERFEESVRRLERFIGTRSAQARQQLEVLPAQPSPPRDTLCFAPMGALAGSFDTAWNSLDNDAVDPRAFRGELVSELTDFDYTPRPGGLAVTLAGIDAENDDPGFEAAIVLVIEQQDGSSVLAVISTARERLDPGELAIDHQVARGLLVRRRGEEDSELVGIMADGLLRLDAAGISDGAPIRGSFEASVYDPGPLLRR